MYSDKFFNDINTKKEYRVAAKFFASKLDDIHIKSVIDVGGGTGLNCLYFRTKGKICIDFSENARKYCNVKFYLGDLTKPFPNEFPFNRRYDMVLCIEVAEHIPEEFSDIFLDNVVSLGDTIFFTAAVPGQGGILHYNEQPKEYWLEKFKSRGYSNNTFFTDKMNYEIKNIKDMPYWFKDSTSIFYFTHGTT